MPYITREDGERFVIPSYRDVLIAKKENLLRKEILMLSTNYGEYITLQRKGTNQFEVAFSPDPGYLLGETVWHYFKRPQDLIYCEAIPNTSEAILVIVKSGSVYLDGSFPLDAIPDELVIFRTQQNNFDIYIYGDVPISQTPEEGKFAFDTASVKSFAVLDEPAFSKLPLVKTFQLQLVDVVLKEKGIGVFPIKKVLLALVVLVLVWMGYSYITSQKEVVPIALPPPPNPYLGYYEAFKSPDPAEQIRWLSTNIWLLTTMPGWYPNAVEFANGTLRASVKSMGARTNLLFEWADQNHADIEIAQTGFFLKINSGLTNRPRPATINRLNDVIANLIDSLSYVIPGNNLSIGTLTKKGVYSEREITINYSNISPTVLDLISRQLVNLPLVLVKVSSNISTNGNLSGSITLRALGT